MGGASCSVSMARASPKLRQTAALISIVPDVMVCIVSEAAGPPIAPQSSDVLARIARQGHGPFPPIAGMSTAVARRARSVYHAERGSKEAGDEMKRVHINITVTEEERAA